MSGLRSIERLSLQSMIDDVAGVLVVGLAAWRIASLLVFEAGPFHVFARLRDWARLPNPGLPPREPRALIGGILSCVWCASVWLAAILWVVWSIEPRAILWLAAAALAPLIESRVRK